MQLVSEGSGHLDALPSLSRLVVSLPAGVAACDNHPLLVEGKSPPSDSFPCQSPVSLLEHL